MRNEILTVYDYGWLLRVVFVDEPFRGDFEWYESLQKSM